MARGWESKDVEAQVEAGQQKPQKSWSGQEPKSPERILHEQQRQDLCLSRTRIVSQLEGAEHPQHRKSLEAALAHLDRKIAELDSAH